MPYHGNNSTYLEIKVSQSSLARRLTCGRIFRDHSIRQSLLSLLV